MQRLPLTIQTAYADLLERLQDDSLLAVVGTPVLRTIKGRKYWYARNYVGNVEKERYLGPDNSEIRERMLRLKQEKAKLKEREQRRRALVQALRGKGLPHIDATTAKVLQALARTGVFRLRAVLVGSHAFRLYPFILGVTIPEAHHATEDIDLAQFPAISVALDDKVEPSIQEALTQVGELTPAASLYENQPTGYRIADTLVEVLAPNQGPDRDEPIELPALGIYAKPLRFLDFLLADAMPAVVPYRYGVLVNVPQPARYAIHKLIVATRRAQTAAKAGKDIVQAAALIRVLAEDQPDSLASAHEEASGRGRAWQEALRKGANRLDRETKALLKQALSSADG